LLLRLHLDRAEGVEAREVLTKFPGDRSACFNYSKVLLEYISWRLLQEEGASEQIVQTALKAGAMKTLFFVQTTYT
jgi:hypothetical protein